MNFRDKQTLVFLMQQAQRPRNFKASGFFTFSLPNYTAVIFIIFAQNKRLKIIVNFRLLIHRIRTLIY